jgi:hypothetical protein
VCLVAGRVKAHHRTDVALVANDTFRKPAFVPLVTHSSHTSKFYHAKTHNLEHDLPLSAES